MQPQLAASMDSPKVQTLVAFAAYLASVALLQGDVLAHSSKPGEVDEHHWTCVSTSHFPNRSASNVILATQFLRDHVPATNSQRSAELV
jgi:hypothetical protein